jgi:hypothetical protein
MSKVFGAKHLFLKGCYGMKASFARPCPFGC